MKHIIRHFVIRCSCAVNKILLLTCCRSFVLFMLKLLYDSCVPETLQGSSLALLHLFNEGNLVRPFTQQQLKSHNLTRRALLWKEMSNQIGTLAKHI